MSVLYLRPWTRVNTWPGYPPSVSGGNLSDWNADERSPLVKTPSGKWRPPTNYSREVNTGYVYGHMLHANMTHYAALTAAYDGFWDWSGGYYRALPAIPQYMKDGCITRCLLKLKDSNVNFSQSFGERKQTARLVRSNIDRITGLAKHLWKREFGKAWRQLKETQLHDLWLELQYGVRPLVGEVYGAMKELNQRESIADRVRVTVKARASENYFSAHESEVTVGNYIRLRQHVRGSHRCFVRLDYVQNDNVFPAGLSRLGITNPLLLAWELLPWSFVVDWFVPVGKYFNTLDAAYGWQFRGGSMSTTTRQSVRAQTPVPILGNGWISGSATAEGEGNQFRFDRVAYTSSPLPQRPHLNKAGNAEHVANGLALMNSALSKLFSGRR